MNQNGDDGIVNLTCNSFGVEFTGEVSNAINV